MNTIIRKTFSSAIVSGVAVLAVGCGSAPADVGLTVSPPEQEQPARWGGPDKYEHQPQEQPARWGGPDKYEHQPQEAHGTGGTQPDEIPQIPR